MEAFMLIKRRARRPDASRDFRCATIPIVVQRGTYANRSGNRRLFNKLKHSARNPAALYANKKVAAFATHETVRAICARIEISTERRGGAYNVEMRRYAAFNLFLLSSVPCNWKQEEMEEDVRLSANCRLTMRLFTSRARDLL